MKPIAATSALLLFLSIFFCGGNLLPGSDSPAYTLRIGIDSYPVSLNPVYTTSETSQAIANKIYNGLFYFDPKGKIKADLVESTTYKNHREIIITLKKKIFFSDGKELASDDVIQTVRLLKDKRFKYPYISNLNFIHRLEKIDGFTFKLILTYPFVAWKNYLTFKVLNCREIEAAAAETFRDKILSGTGPYKIKTLNPPTKIVLESNDAYNLSSCVTRSGPGLEDPDDPAEQGERFNYLEYIVISYTQLSPLKLLKNEIHLCELHPEHIDAYNRITAAKWQQKFRIFKYKKFGYTYLVFNLKNSSLTREIRRLLYDVLVKGDFLDRFLKGKGERVASPFLFLESDVKPAHFAVPPLPKPLTLKILVNSESKLRKKFVLFLREVLKPYKISLQPVFLEYHSFLEHLKKGRFEMAVSGYILDFDYNMADILASDGYYNYARFHCGEMDRLLEHGLQETDMNKREKIYLEAHRVWQEHIPFIPLFNLYYYVGVSNQIAAPAQTYEVVGSAGDFLFNIRQWKMKAYR